MDWGAFLFALGVCIIVWGNQLNNPKRAGKNYYRPHRRYSHRGRIR